MAFTNGTTKFTYFFAGCGMGAVLALLYAPLSGEATRELLRAKAEQGRETFYSKEAELREQVQGVFQKGKELRKRLAERFTGAFEAYKETYHAALGR